MEMKRLLHHFKTIFSLPVGIQTFQTYNKIAIEIYAFKIENNKKKEYLL